MTGIALVGATGMIGSGIRAALEPRFGVKKFGAGPGNNVRLDMLDPDAMTPGQFAGCDTLLHCAGIVDEDFSVSSREGFFKGTYAAEKLAETAFAGGVRSFVYISSAHVYGTLGGRISENTPPNPLSDYAISHYASEQIFRRTAQKDPHGRALILRPCATFGFPASLERFRRWSLIPFRLPRQACETGSISLLPGSDRIWRNFISSQSVGGHVAHFLGDAAPGEIRTVNPVGAWNFSVKEFADLVADVYTALTGKPCPVTMAATVEDAKACPPLDYISTQDAQFHGQDLRDFLKLLIERLPTLKDQAA